MEDIYCDFDVVFDELFDMVDSHDKYELTVALQNVNVGLIEDAGKDGLGDFIEVFSEHIGVIQSDYCKVIFEYFDVFIVLYYSVNMQTTTFNAKIFHSLEDADELYMSI